MMDYQSAMGAGEAMDVSMLAGIKRKEMDERLVHQLAPPQDDLGGAGEVGGGGGPANHAADHAADHAEHAERAADHAEHPGHAEQPLGKDAADKAADVDESPAGLRPAKKKRAPNWLDEEVNMMMEQYVSFYEDYFRKHFTMRRKTEGWEAVSRELAKNGYVRSPEQCQTKWHNLVKRHKAPAGKADDGAEYVPKPAYTRLLDSIIAMEQASSATCGHVAGTASHCIAQHCDNSRPGSTGFALHGHPPPPTHAPGHSYPIAHQHPLDHALEQLAQAGPMAQGHAHGHAHLQALHLPTHNHNHSHNPSHNPSHGLELGIQDPAGGMDVLSETTFRRRMLQRMERLENLVEHVLQMQRQVLARVGP